MPAIPVRAALAEIWRIAGGAPGALDTVKLTGAETALPSSFAVGTMAQATIAASALAAAEVWRTRTGEAQAVSVDMRHAAVEFRSENYMQVPGVDPRTWDKVAGVYQTGDGRYVRLHTNLPHHRSGMLELLGADRLIYASDFPHEGVDDIMEGLQEFQERQDVSLAVKERILRDNITDLYSLR